MNHLTLFLSFCWIFWFSQIFAISTICGLTEIPAASVITLGTNNASDYVDTEATAFVTDSTITVTEEHNSNLLENNETINSDNINSPSLSNSIKNTENSKPLNDKDFIILSELKPLKDNANVPRDTNIPLDSYTLSQEKSAIDDSGGGASENLSEDLTSDNEIKDSKTKTATIIPSDVNLTSEENPIPVFSEWTQKQMQEAEKRLEKDIVNSSVLSSKRNSTKQNNKLKSPSSVKLRAKNYASPDCGAKIIASNSEAQNTAALLSSSKDEYMLSPCTNRIWFVIELCEAIQLEKVNLANFELFSSSPKNFSVSVSNRFPTREWLNVGRFIAADNRNVQSFDLNPHLFGKFVRVDVHSHYNSEHFCPISLFHVYGTSEFEAFETENRLQSIEEDVDDDDDDEILDDHQQKPLKIENNIFKSASDAVLSIVKKAAEALVVKTNSNKTIEKDITTEQSGDYNNTLLNCMSLKEMFSCDKCNQTFVDSVNYLLACKYMQLESLLNLLNSDICAKRIHHILKCYFNDENCEKYQKQAIASVKENVFDSKQKLLLNILPVRYFVALCHLKGMIVDNLDYEQKQLSPLADYDKNIASASGNDTSSSLNEVKNDRNEIINTEIEDKKLKEVGSKTDHQKLSKNSDQTTSTSDEIVYEDQQHQQLNKNTEDTEQYTTENVNIFNIVDTPPTPSLIEETIVTKVPTNDQQSQESLISTEENLLEDTIKIDEGSGSGNNKPKETENEQGTWESIDKLLSEQMTQATTTAATETIDSSNVDRGTEEEKGNTVAVEQNQATTQRVQSESIFIRLSNRVKALERNMSLSGQYLEELSRRYKKQVEELQHSFMKTLSAIEEQNRNVRERENHLTKQNKQLEKTVENINIRLNSLMACLLPLLVLQFVLSWCFIRSYRRQHLELIQRYEENILVHKRKQLQQQQRKKSKSKLSRRISVEGVVRSNLTASTDVKSLENPDKKTRRPSEEATMHLTGSYTDLLKTEEDKGLTNTVRSTDSTSKQQQRQRKISVFLGKMKNDSVSKSIENLNSTLEDSQLIHDEDYETYVPGTDLAYNEFMPDGPSGQKSKNKINNSNSSNSIHSSNNLSINASSQKQKKLTSKMRKLQTAKFLKSPFNNSNNHPHGPTGWEWYKTSPSQSSPPLASTKENFSKFNHSLSDQVVDVTSHEVPKNENINGFLTSSTNSSISGLTTGSATTTKMTTTNITSELQQRLNNIKNSSNSDDSTSTQALTPNNSSNNLSNGNNIHIDVKKRSSFRKIFKKMF